MPEKQDEEFDAEELDVLLEWGATTAAPTTPKTHTIRALQRFYEPQAQAERDTVERVRARLAAAVKQGANHRREELPVIVPLLEELPRPRAPRSGRMRRVGMLFQSAAAVLIVSLLVGGFVTLLFAARGGGPAATAHWSIVGSPNPVAHRAGLSDLAVVSSHDIWAVGGTGSSVFNAPGQPDQPEVSEPLIEHWDGQRWQIVQGPHLAEQAILLSVAAVSANDVWAVGTSGSAKGLTQLLGQHTLIEHWNGKQWQVVPSPNPGKTRNELTGITALSANDIWAIGVYTNQQDGPDYRPDTQGLIEHWDGRQWSVVPGSHGGAPEEFADISAVSADDIWIVGSYTDKSSGGVIQPLIEHWNGERWSIVESPALAPSGMNTLNGVTALAADDVWAVGRPGTPDVAKALIEHWDGKRWSIVPGASAGKIMNFLYSITAISPRDIWAIGIYTSDNKSYNALVEHWDGKRWSLAPAPPQRLGWTLQTLTSITHDPQTGRIWVVGTSGRINPLAAQTLVLTFP